MEDSEKLKALKKAYADIILNTAKEAAAKIMVSERRAMGFQQELVSTKEESLRMLLRLKQMLDSKVNGAELMSSSQQKKIDELEAQLQEAEEIVRDVRAELRETQAVLEKVTKDKMHSSIVQNIESGIAARENCLQENILDPSDAAVYSVPDLQFGSVTVNDSRNSTINATNDSSKLGAPPHDHVTRSFINNPHFASIIVRRKEPKLYRNGCTQRIHAFERNLFDGSMAPSGNVNDVQRETLIRVDDGKTVPVTADPMTDIICETAKPDEAKPANAVDDRVKVPVHSKQQRRKVRLGQILHSNNVKETGKASGKFSRSKGSREKNSSLVCANEAPKVSTDPATVVEQSASHNDTEKGEVLLENCGARENTKDDKELLDKSSLTRPEILFTDSLDVPACIEDVGTATGSSDKPNPEASDLDEKVSSPSVNDKFLKYTFQRKRKKEPVIASPGIDSSLENCTSKKKYVENQNGHVDSQKSCTMTESTRESRRLAQVARQLISLSEKKW